MRFLFSHVNERSCTLNFTFRLQRDRQTDNVGSVGVTTSDPHYNIGSVGVTKECGVTTSDPQW